MLPQILGALGSVGKAAGSIFGSLGPLGPALLDKGFDKVTGVPTPPSPSGGQQGQEYQDFLSSAFPGTTPWERLGASTPMGAIQSAEISRKVQMEMQKKELQNRLSIADMNNRAGIISASAGLGPPARDSNLATYSGGQGGPYDTGLQQSAYKLGAERDELLSRSSKQKVEAGLGKARLPYESQMAQAQLRTEKMKPWAAGAGTLAAIAGLTPWGQAYKGIKGLVGRFGGYGKRPLRFEGSI